ncbi:hypothetical protein QTH89_09840 [Variovorax sp. J22G21]|uniref:hypothetical protein n=1 Tax=Variovorax fucosicus TaxID=3053517 RepID=UPI002576DAB7|nr:MULTISPECIES: hypothetical protein [unclassified Variovorax]MDM0040126.1 hypothetical protein [Variovorax sp. J22R193]MDM0061499.1 hypothetical protein [Variovorax sp. J22G21]
MSNITAEQLESAKQSIVDVIVRRPLLGSLALMALAGCHAGGTSEVAVDCPHSLSTLAPIMATSSRNPPCMTAQPDVAVASTPRATKNQSPTAVASAR